MRLSIPCLLGAFVVCSGCLEWGPAPGSNEAAAEVTSGGCGVRSSPEGVANVSGSDACDGPICKLPPEASDSWGIPDPKTGCWGDGNSE